MGIRLSEDLRTALRDPASLKVIAGVNRAGEPHVVFKEAISMDSEGRNLQCLELLETSQTNRNLTHSLWFQRKIAVNVLHPKGRSWQIKGLPVKVHISGPLFEEQYIAVRNRLGPEADLSAVWIIEPLEEKEQTYLVRLREERLHYPLVGHLDRFTRAFQC
ncbi:MAG: hypothetical protein LBR82_00865 [Desulfovibrio sp.]|jgi:hypothetical protein|nr:hypothetical protein [Desulfovibrio sp.]